MGTGAVMATYPDHVAPSKYRSVEGRLLLGSGYHPGAALTVRVSQTVARAGTLWFTLRADL